MMFGGGGSDGGGQRTAEGSAGRIRKIYVQWTFDCVTRHGFRIDWP